MDARNPEWGDPAHTYINLEINHPAYGWIPFTATPNDVEAHGREIFAAAVAGDFGAVTAFTLPVLSDEEQLAAYELDLDAFLDAKAQALTFKDRHSLALRGAYPNQWRVLGEAFGTWMDTCNGLAWAGRQAILAGTKPMPASKEEFLAELPEFEVPD